MEVPLADLRRAYKESTVQLLQIWRNNEDISLTDQIRLIIIEASGKAVDLPKDLEEVEELKEAYVGPLFQFPPKLNVEAIATLQEIRGRARKLGLISNTGRSPGTALRELMANLDILHFFDATLFSDEVGYRKPDRRIFEAAMVQLGSTPQRTIHIGDDPDADIRGAKQMGMHAVLFDYPVPEEFRRDPSSLFALTRANRGVANSEVEPDAKVTSLKETVAFVDSLT
jgi:putative hydrolase of the HAD superfamily